MPGRWHTLDLSPAALARPTEWDSDWEKRKPRAIEAGLFYQRLTVPASTRRAAPRDLDPHTPTTTAATRRQATPEASDPAKGGRRGSGSGATRARRHPAAAKRRSRRPFSWSSARLAAETHPRRFERQRPRRCYAPAARRLGAAGRVGRGRGSRRIAEPCRRRKASSPAPRRQMTTSVQMTERRSGAQTQSSRASGSARSVRRPSGRCRGGRCVGGPGADLDSRAARWSGAAHARRLRVCRGRLPKSSREAAPRMRTRPAT
mmetsp:Transcript_164839/g.528945  ORF Transcript_164839/g.528945 Transcript_164839/m.528945 type:complete len:261 (-) Transcript_164839:2170-2952(-)